ncbi:MAG TPA: hypothetical protein VF665_03035 [Longimicrobium sp.]|jgi:hypothetical protein|uniref:hypothetical protein n=1 Tax=Longimicrobium sp. TaxID=2029185 RepID=UPI002ED7F2C2
MSQNESIPSQAVSEVELSEDDLASVAGGTDSTLKLIVNNVVTTTTTLYNLVTGND